MKEKISQLFNFVKRNKFKLLPIFLLVIFLVPDLSFAVETQRIFYVIINSIVDLVLMIVRGIYQAAVQLFDNFLFVTLSADFYNMDFVKMGWGVLRDFANVAFILGIIVIGFYMIIGRSEGVDGWKRMLLNIIIAAIAMNFSLFAGRVIIDMGNFTAGVFYRMTAVGNDSSTAQNSGDYFYISKMMLGKDINPWYGKKSFGSAIAMNIGVEGIIKKVNDEIKSIVEATFKKDGKNGRIEVEIGAGQAIWNSIKNSIGLDDGGMTKNTRHKKDGTYVASLDPKQYMALYGIEKQDIINWMKIVGFVVSIFIYIFLAKVFFVVAFTFLVRTGLLIYALIKAPVYFAWSFLPGGDLAFKKWFTEIATKSFCIVVFTLGLWMLFVFIQPVMGAFAKDMTHKTVGGGFMPALILAMSIVIAKAVLIVGPIKALGNATTKFCEGEGNSLGHKVWGAMMGVGAFMGSLVVPGGFMLKKFGGGVVSNFRKRRERIPPSTREDFARPKTKVIKYKDPSSYLDKDKITSKRLSDLKDFIKPKKLNVLTDKKKNDSTQIISENISKGLANVLHPQKDEKDPIKEFIKSQHHDDTDAKVKTAENIAAEKPEIVKRADDSWGKDIKGISGTSLPTGYGTTMMANLKEQATQPTQESGTASNILEGKQIVINTDNAKVDARGAVNMTGDKNNLAAEKAAQENKDQKSIENVKNDTVNDKSEIDKKISMRKDIDAKGPGKTALNILKTVGGGAFNLGKKAFDMADNQFASKDYLSAKQKRQEKYAESNKKWAERQKEAEKAVKDFERDKNEARDDLQIARDFGDEKAEAKALKKIERLKKKEKDIQKKVEKASTRSGQSLGKDIADIFKKAVVPEFAKIGKTISGNQKSSKELSDIKKELHELNMTEKKEEQINKRMARKKAQKEANERVNRRGDNSKK